MITIRVVEGLAGRRPRVSGRASLAPSRRRSLSSRKSLSGPASGEEEDSAPAPRPGVCNREIVRRGALILFCDYVVSAGRERWRSVGGGEHPPYPGLCRLPRPAPPSGRNAESVFRPALTDTRKQTAVGPRHSVRKRLSVVQRSLVQHTWRDRSVLCVVLGSFVVLTEAKGRQ